MTTSSGSNPYSIEESLSTTDRELFSLFLQYPEIDFDNDEPTKTADPPDSVPAAGFDPSPISTDTEGGSNTSTLVADTTSTSTSKRRPRSYKKDSPGSGQNPGGVWDNFAYPIQSSKLPEQCLQYYRFLAKAIVNVGSELLATVRPGRQSSVTALGDWLLKNISYSSGQAAAQVEGITGLKQLVAFNVDPSGSYLWTTYMQRAKLITSNLALPSRQELELIKSLVVIYENHVHGQVLEIPSLNIIDDQTRKTIYDIHDGLTTWLHSYKQWCKGMTELRNHYMKPLIDDFAVLPEAQDEFNDFQERISKARSALVKPVDSCDEAIDKVVQSLNLSARRPGPATSMKRSRTRYKREHTL